MTEKVFKNRAIFMCNDIKTYLKPLTFLTEEIFEITII